MSRVDEVDGRPGSDSSVLADLVDRLTAKMQAGEPIDWEEAARQHPDHAGELLRLRPALGALGDLSRSAAKELSGVAPAVAPADGLASGVLGDFRILREVGRGGMGVVYEAEQVSLGRRVALKVLPFAATMDPRHLQRFQNEARAAACLHHSNIVPVYYVGSERGVHFYAMQFIDGQTLAAVIQDLRRPTGQAPPGADPDVPTTAHVPAGGVVDPKADTAPAARQSTLATERSTRSREYFRRVAQLGVQAAEALDHAHEAGIVHRDVKPGNLLLDGRGCVWVADFGLAHIQHGEANLTMTGDLLGTLRYMSPEQALAKRVPIDHRTDVYSLGATLYELLTLQPAFSGKDRQEILRQIAFEEPKPPRRIAKGVPAELEIIVLKAMGKNPAERYGTAQEMADDLRRFLDDKPIRARRPSLARRAAKWARRHRAGVTAAVLCLLVTLAALAGSVGWLLGDRAARQREADGKVREALEAAEPGLRQGNPWDHELISAARRAEAQLGSGVVGPESRRQVQQLQKDVRMLAELERVRLDQAKVREGHFDMAASDPQSALAFREYGIDVETLAPDEAAALIQRSAIRNHLVTALDYWALSLWAEPSHEEKVRRLVAVARQADPDPWRNRLREAVLAKAVPEQLLRSAPIEELPADALGLLAELMAHRDKAIGPAEVELLWSAQRRCPADFWINHELASALCHKVQPPRLEKGIGFYRAAVALHPESPGVRLNLGNALDDQGKHDEAEKEFREAIRLMPDYAAAHNNLGIVLKNQGKDEEAEKEYREAIRLEPDYANAYYGLGNVLRRKGFLDDAIDAYKEAIRLEPDFEGAYLNLGITLHKKGSQDKAIDAYKEAIRIKPDYAEAYNNLGNALRRKGSLDDAVAALKEAIRLKADYAEPHYNLGKVLHQKGSLDEAIGAYQEAIHLKPDYADAYDDLGNALDDKGSVDKAIDAYKEALHLKPDFARAYYNLGLALSHKGSLDEAVHAYKEAIRLKPDDAEAYDNLGIALAMKGSLDDAVDAFKEAIRLQADDAEAYNNLGNALTDLGSLDKAVAAYKEATRLKPDYAEAHYSLGLALEDQGQFMAALAALRRGHELGSRQPGWPYPSAQAVRRGERAAACDSILPTVLRGQASPAGASAALGFAELCQLRCKRLYAASARFYADAFAEQPGLAEEVQSGNRYNAACAAALAGCGQGEDVPAPDEKERMHLRRQALDWLRADLKAQTALTNSKIPGSRNNAFAALRHWQEDTDLAGVRGEAALAMLPEAEREEWRTLWADVEKTLAQAPDAAPEGKGKDKP